MFLDDEDNVEYTTTKEEYITAHERSDNVYLNCDDGFTLSDIGPCHVRINGFGGNTPHFEIVSDDGKFKSCMKLYEPEYYFRDRKEFSKLNNKQLNELIKHLKSPCGGGSDVHGCLHIYWLHFNDLKKYEHYNEGYIMPDYSKLKEK